MPARYISAPTVKVGTASNREITWFAAGGDYPIYFRFKRGDYNLFAINNSSITPGKAVITISSQTVQTELAVGGTFEINTTNYGNKSGIITAITSNFGFSNIETDIDFIQVELYDFINTSGFINLISARRGYRVKFTAYNPNTNEEYSSIWVSPNPNGEILVDIAGLMSRHIKDEPIALPAVNGTEPESAKPFTIRWADSFDNVTRYIQQTFYVANFANQVRSQYGESLAEHVCELTSSGHLGKILSAFEEPTYFEGYPFILQAVIQESPGNSPSVFRIEEQLDSLATVIATTPTALPDTDYTKVHQITLDGTYAPSIECVNLWLDLDPVFTVTPTITQITLEYLGPCDANTGRYVIALGIYYENLSVGADLASVNVGGAGFSTPQLITNSGQTIFVGGLVADGTQKDVTVQLTVSGISLTVTNLFTAPIACLDCRIFSAELVSTGTADTVAGTFPVTLNLDYANEPTGNINVNGVVIAAPGSGVDFTVDLPLGTDPIDLNVFFVGDTACTFNVPNFVTPPTTYVKRVSEALVATGTNTLPALTQAPRTGSSFLFGYRGASYTNLGASPSFSVAGQAVTFNAANEGFSINTGETVYVEYEVLSPTTPGDNWVYEVKTITSQNVLPGFLQFAAETGSFVLYVNGIEYRDFGADQAVSIAGNSATWMNNQGFNLEVGQVVHYRYRTLVATGNEEGIIEAQTLASQNVIPAALANQPQDQTDLIILIGDVAYFNYGTGDPIALSGQNFTFNSVLAGFNIDAGEEIFPFYQKTV